MKRCSVNSSFSVMLFSYVLPDDRMQKGMCQTEMEEEEDSPPSSKQNLMR